MRTIRVLAVMVLLYFILLYAASFRGAKAGGPHLVELTGNPLWRIVSAAERVAAAEERQAAAAEKQADALRRAADRLDTNSGDNYFRAYP